MSLPLSFMALPGSTSADLAAPGHLRCTHGNVALFVGHKRMVRMH